MESQGPATPDEHSQPDAIHGFLYLPKLPRSRRPLPEWIGLTVAMVVAALILTVICIAGFALNVTTWGPLR